MSAGAVRTAAAVGFAALVAAAVVAPALVLDTTTARGGAGRGQDLDLVLVAVLVALPYAAVVQRRLRAASAVRGRAVDAWLADVHGLVVLSLAASGVPAAALHASAGLHARLVDAEWPVLLAWAGMLAAAVLLGEGTRRLSLRWLRSDQRGHL